MSDGTSVGARPVGWEWRPLEARVYYCLCTNNISEPRDPAYFLESAGIVGYLWNCVHGRSPVHYKWFSLKLYESCFQNYTFLNESLVQFSRVDSTAREIQPLQQQCSSRAGVVLCLDFFTFSKYTGGQNSHQWFSDILYDSILDTLDLYSGVTP